MLEVIGFVSVVLWGFAVAHFCVDCCVIELSEEMITLTLKCLL